MLQPPSVERKARKKFRQVQINASDRKLTPSEFEDLHNDVLDVLRLSRNSSCLFTDEENALRKKRHFKFSSRERLFLFLMFYRQYPT